MLVTNMHWYPSKSVFISSPKFMQSLQTLCYFSCFSPFCLDACIPVSSIPSRSTLPSSARGHMVVPQTQTPMAHSRSFAIVGLSNLNKLPQSLRGLFPISPDQFCKHLKTSLFVSEDNDLGREHH